MEIKVSLIVASYNYAAYIGKTIESIIQQTVPSWELIVVDDGSNDNSIDIIKSYCTKDSRIKLLTHSNNCNKGLAETLQLGINNAKGEYIAFVESDDYIVKDYLEKKFEIFNKYPDLGFIYNNVETFGERVPIQLQKHLDYTNQFWKNIERPLIINNEFRYRNIVPTFSCVMLKKNLIKECDFNSPVSPLLDWWLWAQLSGKTKFFFINEKLTYWRIHKNSYISSHKKTKNSALYLFYRGIDKNSPKQIGLKNKILFFITKTIYQFIKFKFLIYIEKIKEKKF